MEEIKQLENNTLVVTSLQELKRASSGEIVPLPPFIEGSEFNAKLKRPAMLDLVGAGKIPNELLVSANELFTSGVGKMAVSNVKDAKMMEELLSIVDVFCEAAFVEPTYKVLCDNGIRLTDEQKLAVFQYCQTGVKSLKSFRG